MFGIDDAISAIGNVAGAVIGQVGAGAARGAAQDATQQAVQAWDTLSLPDLKNLIAQQLGPSALENVSDNPDLERQQLDSLAQLGNIADSGGETLTDKVNLADALSQGAQKATATRQSIANMLARNGVQTSGANVALQLGAARDQQAAAATAGAQNAAQAQQRAIQAIAQRGQQAGAVRTQDYTEAAAKAKASDMINQYNANARTAANQYNSQLGQTGFEDAYQKAGGTAGAYQNLASADLQQAAQIGQQAANTGSGLGAIGGSIAKSLMSPSASAATGPQTNYGSVTPAASLNPDDPNYGGY